MTGPGEAQSPGQGELFVSSEPAPLPRVRPKPTDMTGTPVWSRYSAVSRLPCDDCHQAQHEGTLHEPARQARWKRLVWGSGRLLCHEHAQHWRHEDGLDVPAAMKGKGR